MPMAADEGLAAEYAVMAGEDGLVLLLDDEQIGLAPDVNGAVTHLLWHVNHEMIRRTDHLILLHAAAAEYKGLGIMLPAPMEAGKSTLVAGLILSGFRYLTDEAVGVDPMDLTMHPYPKPLSLDPGSWPLLSELEPDLLPQQDPALRKQWHVSPLHIDPSAMAPRVKPRLIISPAYEAGARTELVTTSRAEMLTMLGECAFEGIPGRRALAVLARVVKASSCYRLRMGDLSEAVSLVKSAVFALRESVRETPKP